MQTLIAYIALHLNEDLSLYDILENYGVENNLHFDQESDPIPRPDHFAHDTLLIGLLQLAAEHNL